MEDCTELLQRIRKTSNGRLKLRYLAVLHFREGKSRAAISRLLKVRRSTVNDWIKAYLNGGLGALEEKPRSGRSSKLTQEQKEHIYNYVVDKAKSTDGGRLTGLDIKKYIYEKFGINYCKSNIYKILHAIGLSWITSRSRHPKQSEAVQEDFKKNFLVR